MRASLVAAILAMLSPSALACYCPEYRGPQPAPTAEAQAVLDQARELERTNARRAIAMYKASVGKLKDGHAAKRLAEIYDMGIPGVQRDYGASLYWHDVAEKLGVRVSSCSCGSGR